MDEQVNATSSSLVDNVLNSSGVEVIDNCCAPHCDEREHCGVNRIVLFEKDKTELCDYSLTHTHGYPTEILHVLKQHCGSGCLTLLVE